MLFAAKDLDYWMARLHGRRSLMAEGTRLDVLCRLHTVAELARALGAPPDVRAARELQKWLVDGWVHELLDLATRVTGAVVPLLGWQVTRIEVENLKILARGFTTATPAEQIQEHLIALPHALLAYDATELARAHTFEVFVEALPAGAWRRQVAAAAEIYQRKPVAFVIECVLDSCYFTELLQRARALQNGAHETVMGLVKQEVDIYHTLLVARGALHYGLAPAWLATWYVPDGSFSSETFRALLEARDVATLTKMVARQVLDRAPLDGSVAALELFGWSRYWRLANGAFRRNHMDDGAMVGYAALRRMELANLITLSEGLRMGLDGTRVRERLIPLGQEVSHV